ncbi:MAG: mutS [Clostridia bacterium]|nr:mutS [Clostridia bacterium]
MTPMMQQYLDIKEQHKDKIIFFRLGDFYEMFFDDALTASRELEITLTGRDCGMAERAPMCGIPHHAAENYISRLIAKNYKVAICEQVEDPAVAKGIVKREVVRIVTPGTVTETTMLDEKSNNYLMAIYHTDKTTSIAYVDLSTGEFYCTQADTAEQQNIVSEISRINPSEAICNNEEGLRLLLQETSQLNATYFDLSTCERRLKKQFGVTSLEGLGLDSEALVRSAGAIIVYLDEIQKVALNNINSIKNYSISSYMILDMNTRRNLELIETMRGKNRKGALISVIDKTSTSMGGRMLKAWIEKPLLNPVEINERLDGVQELYNEFLLREELKEYLRSIYDLERLGSRIALGSANARDLIAFKNSTENLPHIKNLIHNCTSKIIKDAYEQLDPLQDIYELINQCINEEAPIALKEGNLIKKGNYPELDKLKEGSTNGKQWIAELEQKEKEKTGIKNLKVGFNRVFGYYIDITKSNYSQVPDYFIRKQTLANSERYITPELKELEEMVLGAEEKLIELEYQLFIEIRSQIAQHINRIQKTASQLSILDCICSFAETAQKNGYCRPTVNSENMVVIKDGRHPVVEVQSNSIKFVPNDTDLDTEDNRMLIITGPNMAGKSTYMRQVALITLMAQTGSFVPAKEAVIGVVDRIFTRVGASDDLASGQSTFMVEMSELANIINNATKKSLIILDEIGRGTSTFDGLSIAWSVVEHISGKESIGAKTLFATHYHELTELEGKIEGIKNYCISVEEKGKDIVFLRKIIRGGANGSYGIHVARLAGIPENILQRSEEILVTLEKTEETNHSNLYVKEKKKKQTHQGDEINLFNFGQFSVLDEIKALDINNMTPMQAFHMLSELHKKAKDLK